MLPRFVSIVGPTAVGKTALGARLTEQYDLELVSADSVQVYKGLDIISGKDIDISTKFYPQNFPQSDKYDLSAFLISDNNPIYLLDIVTPDYAFNTYDFITCAEVVSEHILNKNKIPCFIGGTGLYVKGFFEGMDTLPGPDMKLRSELSLLSADELYNKLHEVHPEKAEGLNESERNNKQRLIRYIEVSKEPVQGQYKKRGDVCMIGLSCDREVLRRRIDERVQERIEQGAFDEASELFKSYNTLSNQVRSANGYKQLFSFFQGEYSKEEAIDRWKLSEYKHAKNQMTWFRKYGDVLWFDIQDNGFEDRIREKIDTFLST